jgi:hypothetical protein
VLGELFLVDGEHDLQIDPDGLGHGRWPWLFREFAEHRATLLLDHGWHAVRVPRGRWVLQAFRRQAHEPGSVIDGRF